MTHIIYRDRPKQGREILGSYDTFNEAEAAVKAMGDSHYERDIDYPGCADAFIYRTGDIVSICPQ